MDINDKLYYLIRTLDEMIPAYRFKVSYDIPKDQYAFRAYIEPIHFPLTVIVDGEEFIDKNEFQLADEIRDAFSSIINELIVETE